MPAVNKKGKVNWRGVVVSVTLCRECASKINECNFKSGEQDPVLGYPQTFVGTLVCSLTTYSANGCVTTWKQKLWAQSRVRDQR